MKTVSKIILAATVAGSLVGTAFAQEGGFPAGGPPCGGARGMAYHHRHDGGARLESRLSVIKSDLKITPDQEAAWTAFESAVKSQVRTMPHRPGPEQRAAFAKMTAPERAQLRATRMQERAQGAQNIAQAVKALYAQLTPEQKQTADRLMAGGHHRAG